MSTQAELQEQTTKPSQTNGNGGAADNETPKSGNRKFILLGIVLLIAIAAAFYYYRSTFTEDTDDAQVDGNLYQVSSRITGHVINVHVDDNQMVQKGQLLVEIDPADYQVALLQAEANLASAQAQYVQANVNVPITHVNVKTTITTSGSDVYAATAAITQAQKQVQVAEAQVAEAQANATKAQLDVDRYTPLVEKDVISKQQFDAAVAQAAASKASVLQAQASVLAANEQVRQAQQRLTQANAQSLQATQSGPQQVQAQQAAANAAEANVRQAQARVDQAKLNLSYTKIYAPTTGIVNKKNVQVGANLSAGQDLLTVIPLTDLWVTANFKETQIQRMRPCQQVEIKVDALGGRKFTGQVTQIGGATGSKLSLFPPENATGNYVKVVQRIPVRIDFTNLQNEDADFVLRPGFSVIPTVRVKGDVPPCKPVQQTTGQ